MYTPMWMDYDKITDDLMYIGYSTTLQCSTTLSRRDKKTNERISFHKEYGYIKNGERLNSIKRNYSCFLIINNYYAKAYVMIGINDIILMRYRLQQVEKWFSSCFGIKNDKLYITRQQKPVVVDSLAENKWIEFLPTVITREDGTQIQGVNMNLYNECVVEISIDNFYGMKYIIDTINLIDMANHMINYLGRPQLGTNYTDLSMMDGVEEYPNGCNNNNAPNKKTTKKSGFFSQQ